MGRPVLQQLSGMPSCHVGCWRATKKLNDVVLYEQRSSSSTNAVAMPEVMGTFDPIPCPEGSQQGGTTAAAAVSFTMYNIYMQLGPRVFPTSAAVKAFLVHSCYMIPVDLQATGAARLLEGHVLHLRPPLHRNHHHSH